MNIHEVLGIRGSNKRRLVEWNPSMCGGWGGDAEDVGRRGKLSKVVGIYLYTTLFSSNRI